VSVLAREASETAAGAARQIATLAPILDALVARLRTRPPAFAVTCARGSSDHAATYGKYLLETTLGCAVASIGPSIVSTYGRAPNLERALFLAVSQSGKSPDLVQLTSAARVAGALVIGLVNDTTSPLAAECEFVLPLCAGEERSIAATKSFLLACFAFLQLTARWTDDAALLDAVARAPDLFTAATALACPLDLAAATNLYVVGRGVGLSAAQEIALKLKETCHLHAEAFSTAELRHGPIALVDRGFPILALVQADRTEPSVEDTLAHLASLGAAITRLPVVANAPAVLAPLCAVQGFYLALPALAEARGLDADAPSPHLSKVTRTV
jgi:glucosamine--fructose-6-phosphate aminotransferase (isomerizing)